jgi:anaerobic selenocysteine-containing dehydrogenase
MSEIRSNCSICSLACPLILRGGKRSPVFTNESVLKLDWDDSEDSKYGGSLCARGAAMVEFVSHPDRLNYPFVLGERSSYEAAVKEAAKNLAAVKNDAGGDAIGVLIGDNLTNEEAALAVKFARDVVGTENIALMAPDDIPLFRAWTGFDLSGIKPAGEKPTGERQVFLLVGDPFTEHPCTAKVVGAGKYGGRGNAVITVSPEKNHSAWFANKHLACRPGGEPAVLAGLLKAAAAKSGAQLPGELGKLMGVVDWNDIERLGGVSRDDLEAAAGTLLGAARVETYVSNIFGRFGAPGIVATMAEAVTRICPGESVFDAQFVQQNTWGIHSVLDGAGTGKTLSSFVSGGVQAFVLLGVDPFSTFPAAPVENALRDSKFTVATQLFRGPAASGANVAIPAAALVEKKGTVSPSFDEDIVRENTIDPIAGTVTDAQFLTDLANEMGTKLTAAPVERKTGRAGTGESLSGDWAGYAAAMKELENADVVLIPWSEAVHAADGSISRNLFWSKVTCPEPELMVSLKIAEELSLRDGDRLKVSSEGGEAVLTARTTGKLEGKTVAATIHFPSVRKLFPWKLDERHGEISLAPVAVTLGRQSEKS